MDSQAVFYENQAFVVCLYYNNRSRSFETIVKITTRILLILAIMILVMVLAMSGIAQVFILSSSAQIEQQQSGTSVQLVTDQIRSEADQLGTKARDWAVWDDTYQYMVSRNQNYENTVIRAGTTFESLQITGLLYYDINGNLVASQGYDLRNKTTTNLSEGTASYFSQNTGLLTSTRGGKKKTGIVLLPDGPVLAGMHTILPTSGTGPGHGTLVVLRSFDASEVAAIQDRFHLSMQIISLQDPLLGGDSLVSRLSAPDAPPVISRISDDQVIAGYSLIRDIDSRPILVLEVDSPRTASRQALSTLFSLTGAYLIIGILSLVVTGLLLRWYIFTPLNALDTSIKTVGRQNAPAICVTAGNDDEISLLKKNLDKVLKSLQDKDRELAEANQKASLYLDIYLDVCTYEILDVNMSLQRYADLIRKTEGKESIGYADRITETLTRNLAVIRNIETISKIYKNPPGSMPVSIQEILKKEVAGRPRGKIRCDNIAFTVLADAMLGTVFHNIITNRIKFGGSGAEIFVSARDNRDGMVEISIIDTGVGIPDEMKPQLFERFFRDANRRGSYGLGLHIAKMLVEAYGGKIWVADRVPGEFERGTVIRFNLKKA
jgi:sensor domain CHASE-containing protein